jgi:hypothetical protein
LGFIVDDQRQVQLNKDYYLHDVVDDVDGEHIDHLLLKNSYYTYDGHCYIVRKNLKVIVVVDSSNYEAELYLLVLSSWYYLHEHKDLANYYHRYVEGVEDDDDDPRRKKSLVIE